MSLINSIKAPTSWDNNQNSWCKSVSGPVKVLFSDRTSSSAYVPNKAVAVLNENGDNPVFGIADGETKVDERYNINKRGILHHNMRFEMIDPVITVHEGANGRVAKNQFKSNVVSISVAIDQNRMKTDPAYVELVRHQVARVLLGYADTMFGGLQELAHYR
jgi:hypothetical protein